MIDHLLSFSDEAAAKAILPSYWFAGEDGEPDTWRGDRCIPGVSVYAVTGTETHTYPDTGEEYEQEVHLAFPGWFIVISLADIDPVLRDLAGNACRLIADRDAADRHEEFIRYLAADLDPADLAIAHVEPMFAGANYPFGSSP